MNFGEPLGERFVDDATKQAIREEFQGDASLTWRARYYWEYLDQSQDLASCLMQLLGLKPLEEDVGHAMRLLTCVGTQTESCTLYTVGAWRACHCG